MTFTSEEQRRKVAERLRILASHAPADKDYVLDALGLYPGEYIDGFDPYCVNELADLIDRQTCTIVCECDMYSSFGERIEGMRLYELSCGHQAVGFDKPRYCPECGAVITDD